MYWALWLFNARENGLRGGIYRGIALGRMRDRRGTDEHLDSDWLSAVEVSKSRECAMPHDKFYGMLGMIRPRLRIPVDYDRPLVDVFLMVLRRQLFLEWDHASWPDVEIAASSAQRLGKLWCSVEQAVNASFLSIQSMRDLVFDEFVALRFPGPRNETRLQTIINKTGVLARIEASLLEGYDIVRNSDVNDGYFQDHTQRKPTPEIAASLKMSSRESENIQAAQALVSSQLALCDPLYS